MARGVMVIADTKAEAEAQVRDESGAMRVLRSRELDLGGLPPLRSGALSKHWVVVVEHRDADEEAKLPQHEDPEDHCERETRLLYLTMAVNPMLLATGAIERFPCPGCGADVEVRLPADSGGIDHNARCTACKTPLTRRSGAGRWEVIPITAHEPQPCIFCGAIDGSHEHVIPRWISNQLGIRDFLVANERLTSQRRARRKQPISFASHRSQCFCHGCDTHFKQLEDAAMPVLVAMGRGRSLSLGSDSQHLIGLWAAKTAIAVVAADRELQPAVPEEHRWAVRGGRVPESAWVFVLGWRGGATLANATFMPQARADEQGGYAAFLAFGQFAMFVVGSDAGVGIDVSAVTGIPALRQISPRVRPYVDWPPSVAADGSVLAALARMGRVIPTQP